MLPSADRPYDELADAFNDVMFDDPYEVFGELFQRIGNLFLISGILFVSKMGSVIEFKIIKIVSKCSINLSLPVGSLSRAPRLNEYAATGDIRSTVVRWSRK